MPEQQHILSAFDRDLEGIQALVMKMGGMVANYPGPDKAAAPKAKKGKK